MAQVDGYTLFIPFSAPGDKLTVEVTEARKTYGRAKVREVLESGAGRVKAPCPVAGVCGGCTWQHMDYSAQTATKGSLVREALKRIGGLEGIEVEPARGAKEIFGYRNRAQVPVRAAMGGQATIGFFKAGSHTLVALPDEGCRIQSDPMNEVLRFVRNRLIEEKWQPYDEKRQSGQLKHLVLRDNLAGQVMLVLVTRNPLGAKWAERAAAWLKDCAPLASLLNHVQPDTGNRVLGGETQSVAGPEHLEESIDGIKFRLSAESFFQVHRGQTPQLWDLLRQARLWTGREVVAELYCGVGTLSLFLSGLCGRLLGFENSPAAVADALNNASRNGKTNLEFHETDSEKAFERLWDMEITPDVVVVDPPRKGLSGPMMAALLTHQPKEILYVSCDPASLSRDLAQLFKGGYKADCARPLDLFPQTWHVETVVALKREEEAL